jgi:hypothetical protein
MDDAEKPIKLSRAAKYMMGGIAEFEISDRSLPFNCVDYRVYPKLSKLGLVAANIYLHDSGGVCFTPKGRKFWGSR